MLKVFKKWDETDVDEEALAADDVAVGWRSHIGYPS
jgi:hypothetical protein